MKIQCPQCGVRGTLADDYAGRKVRCPKCKALFQADEHPEPLAPAGTKERTPSPEPVGQERGMEEQGEQPVGVEERPGTAATGADGVATSTPPPAEGADEAGTVPPVVPGQREQAQTTGEKMFASGDQFVVGTMLSKAWELTKGVKGPIWGGLTVMYGVSLIILAIITFAIEVLGVSAEGIIVNFLNVVNSALSIIFTAGLMYMGVLRATGRRVVWKDVFAGFSQAGQIVIAGLLQMVLVVIGFFLLVLPGIYLLIGYMMTLPLMVDRGMGPWQAMEASRKAIHKVWWKFFGLYLLVLLMLFISAIPLGLGLFWTAPLSIVLCGVVYVRLFNTDTTEK